MAINFLCSDQFLKCPTYLPIEIPALKSAEPLILSPYFYSYYFLCITTARYNPIGSFNCQSFFSHVFFIIFVHGSEKLYFQPGWHLTGRNMVNVNFIFKQSAKNATRFFKGKTS